MLDSTRVVVGEISKIIGIPVPDYTGDYMWQRKFFRNMAVQFGLAFADDNQLLDFEWLKKLFRHAGKHCGVVVPLALADLIADLLAGVAPPPPPPVAATPFADPVGGQVYLNTPVRLFSATDDAVIRYTTDGSNPTAASAVYSPLTPIVITGAIGASTTVKAFASLDGWVNSAVMTAVFTVISSGTVATPTAAPPGRAVTFPTCVTLDTETTGADIRYTQDGSTPTAASALYTASAKPVITASALTLKAFAQKAGMDDSGVMTETYSEALEVGKPDANLYWRFTLRVPPPANADLRNAIMYLRKVDIDWDQELADLNVPQANAGLGGRRVVGFTTTTPNGGLSGYLFTYGSTSGTTPGGLSTYFRNIQMTYQPYSLGGGSSTSSAKQLVNLTVAAVQAGTAVITQTVTNIWYPTASQAQLAGENAQDRTYILNDPQLARWSDRIGIFIPKADIPTYSGPGAP